MMKIRRFLKNAISVATNPKQLAAYWRWTVGSILVEPTLYVGGKPLRGFKKFSEYWNIAATTASPDEEAFIRRIGSASPFPSVDVGSNIGQMALLLSAVTRQPVHCFEPHPSTFRALMKNCTGSEFFLNQMALSDQEGTAQFTNDRSSALNRMLGTEPQMQDSFEVRTDTLSNYLLLGGISDVSIVKIDVEGAEPLVLTGLQPHLERGLIGGLLIEVVPENLANLGFEIEDIWRRTTPYGYLPYDVRNLSRPLSLAELLMVDVPNVAFMRSENAVHSGVTNAFKIESK